MFLFGVKRTKAVLAMTTVALAGAAYAAPAANAAGAGPGASPRPMPTIVIGSTNFTEQVIVATLYSDVLQHAGFKTKLRVNLGTRLEVEPALAHGALDLYPEYAGSLLVYLKPGDTAKATQLAADLPALRAALARQGATVLQPAPAIDVNVFAVTKATAAKYHLTTLSSLAPVAPKLTFAAPTECPKYAYCLLGLEHVYGIHFKSFVGVESEPTTAAYLKFGRVQVAEFFSSDGTVLENGFVELKDNRHLQPADHLVPLIRKSVATPAVARVLNALSAKLTTEQLERLNIAVNNKHENAVTVADQWLKAQHLT
jgi:osmoprotectant transport system substrate-binding protein